jgi:NADPH2:quinone reductase
VLRQPAHRAGHGRDHAREGHTALVHTAAASNLGQMLNRICLKDGIGLVNIVRKPEQAALLRAQGAQHVCDSSAPTSWPT